MARIMVAEDEQHLREMLAFKLTTLGHQLVGAADGEQAMAMAAAQLPDLIVLDIAMPLLNGLEVLRRLKTDPALRSIPVIILSAKAREHDVRAGLQAGAVDYVVKPFSLKDLAARIERVLGDHRAAEPSVN
jgi:DNA-binding response OmpR family regulator